MKHHASPELTQLKEREGQCIDTSAWFKRHPEHRELLSKKASEHYYERYLKARRDCIEQSKQCPVCKGSANDWT